ncbi:hypothetical protein L6E12_18270 [Actinokineospora sp. PR83]|uniref:hypothetical protein n=1 Tax=Actinokineospora sp. PR83 TaxID=2884908 RepID=UPI001F30DE43|nr:hypothetical protein [Actinokineospora sp. PR83]MCG8917729.1 hypothetical protein [Actinokineospora sp. PR83]
MESVEDPDEALSTWKDTRRQGMAAAEALLRSPHAIPLLRWVLAQAPDGDHDLASAILAVASPAIREQVLA